MDKLTDDSHLFHGGGAAGAGGDQLFRPDRTRSVRRAVIFHQMMKSSLATLKPLKARRTLTALGQSKEGNLVPIKVSFVPLFSFSRLIKPAQHRLASISNQEPDDKAGPLRGPAAFFDFFFFRGRAATPNTVIKVFFFVIIFIIIMAKRVIR